MQNPLIRPRGGLLRLGGGLIKPRGGLLSGLNARASSGIAHTLDGIANAADPLQALADACGMDSKLFTHLWIGNELVGATELGGSGLDLVNTTVDQGQTDARLGAGNTCLFNAGGDRLGIDDSTFNVGFGSMALLSVVARDADANTTVAGKRASATGYRMTTYGTGAMGFEIKTGDGTFLATVPVDHGTTDALVGLGRRLSGSNEVTIHTGEGNGSAAEATVATADSAAQFGVGWAEGVSNGFSGSFGLLAFVKGANAELVTATHRSNLQTWLGF